VEPVLKNVQWTQFLWKTKKHIDMAFCIRCGTCHDVCPEEAVRHDSEKIPIEIEANMEYTNRLMQNFETKVEKREFLGRMIKHFNKEKVVAEKTIERVKMLGGRFSRGWVVSVMPVSGM